MALRLCAPTFFKDEKLILPVALNGISIKLAFWQLPKSIPPQPTRNSKPLKLIRSNLMRKTFTLKGHQ